MRAAKQFHKAENALQPKVNFLEIVFKLVKYLVYAIFHKDMIHKLIILIFLVIFWYAFSGELGGFYIMAGIFSCLLALFISIRIALPGKLVHNHRLFKYIPWLLWQVATSGLHVMRLVWGRKLALSPEFIRLDVINKKEVFYAMYANSITMTPGTVTLLVDEKLGCIYAHAITAKTASDIKNGVMANKVDGVLV